MFLSAAVGILVDQVHMGWDDPISKYIPEFKRANDPRDCEEITIRQALLHSIGLGRPQTLLLGPNGYFLGDEVTFVRVLRGTPRLDDDRDQAVDADSDVVPHSESGADEPRKEEKGDVPREAPIGARQETFEGTVEGGSDRVDEGHERGYAEGHAKQVEKRSDEALHEEQRPRKRSKGAQEDQEEGPTKEGPTDTPGPQPVYNNLLYGLIALAVQNASGQRYSDFVQENILDPLDMRHTVVNRSKLESNLNVAHGYAQLQDGSYTRVATEDYTDENHAPILGAAGIRSSVNDMLEWTSTLLRAYHAPTEDSVVREIPTLWKSQRDIDGKVSYALGYYCGYLPVATIGGNGINCRTEERDPSFFDAHTIGRDSPRRFFIGHNGVWSGYASAVFMFPETKSAVMALANGLNLSDAADWSAKILTQALFDMKPHVDLLPLVKREAGAWYRVFCEMLIEWLEHRSVPDREADLHEYIGKYEGFGTRITIFLQEETGRLAVMFNSCRKWTCDRELYNKDVYSFLPLTRDQMLTKGMVDWDDYNVGLLHFQRGPTEEVHRLCWMYDATEPYANFEKV
ncbi:Uu.00g074400.m01.CDS01 [Anthostomella pinea]|uniref:Uu.00g074400.m01.CDS01 n=1 Tax=Anthostomella pinea TaxID=933095 RepID=A0AAI8VW28_9PEZI|nr:Uu.00g074400.m01.CDS01 [Anthostomella pinea]